MSLVKKDKTELSGLLGESVSIRKVRGAVVLKNRPQRVVTNASGNQLAFKERFLEAVAYAKQQVKQPDIKEEYATGITPKLKSAYAVALTDYLVAPKVGPIYTTDYHGAIGDLIAVKAKDDFMVTRVKIVITNAAGAVIEQGEASPDLQKTFLWNYNASVANPTLAGTKIQAIAYDRPGNITSFEKVM